MKRITGWALAAAVLAGMPVGAQGEDGDAASADDKAAVAAAEKEAKKQREEASKKCIEEFKKSLKEAGSANERAAAIRVLGECGVKDPKIVSAITPYLAPHPADTLLLMPVTAAEALGTFEKDRMAAQALISAAGLYKKESRVLEKILTALGKIGLEQALPLLLDNLDDSNANVAAAAARGLGELKHPQGVEALIEALERLEKDKNLANDTKTPKRGGNKALKEAAKAQQDRTDVVGAALKDALKRATGENISFIEDWQEWWGKNRATFGKPKKEEGEKK